MSRLAAIGSRAPLLSDRLRAATVESMLDCQQVLLRAAATMHNLRDDAFATELEAAAQHAAVIAARYAEPGPAPNPPAAPPERS